MPVLSSFWTTEIRDARELRHFVRRITLLCVAIALSLDVLNQLTFFSGWQSAFRSWGATIAVSGGIAFAAARAIGRAQLALWQAKADLERLSRTDPLTGLLNRRALFADMDLPPQSLTLLIVDIDRFKQVNDAYGHLAGDDVIRQVSRMMQANLGDTGRVGRLGGEEFAFLSFDVSLPDLTRRLLRFRRELGATPTVSQGSRITVTVSGGIAVRREGQSFDDLYATADRALYAAKTAGRNRILIDEGTTRRDIDEDGAGFRAA
jgi:diguanylate cyclase (GGDEF)-like protein